ncbi:MAG: hypothetical protein GF346_04400, partial [Candidatus Eisenbacteria bacterium]|nr:hypothetical protein [Candidatus Latescibacterota bacterium]MBD3301668.1 hypothetical protein [Candidatus Eisenbacteria bacterium]
MRKGTMGIRWSVAAAVFAAGIATLCGCGQQDLYEPPHSPWQISARVPLESSPEDVAVLGDFAYVAGGEAGLVVIDVSDPGSPVLVATIDTKKYAESIKVASVPAGD